MKSVVNCTTYRYFLSGTEAQSDGEKNSCGAGPNPVVCQNPAAGKVNVDRLLQDDTPTTEGGCGLLSC